MGGTGLGGPIFGTVLGIVGSFFGLGAIGFAVGNLIGNILFPPPAPDPPPLGDLSVNTYVRSAPVPIVYGTNKVYGGVIWIGTNYVEMEEQGSSKNPSYSAVYHADFAMAVSEGTIVAYDTLYINDKDISTLTEDDAIDLSWGYYYGVDGQAADSLIDSYLQGLGDYAPGFQWTAYIVGSGKIGKQNSLPTLSVLVSGLCASSAWVEPTPVTCLYDFLTNTMHGCSIPTNFLDGSPTTSGTWATEEVFCSELVLNNLGAMEPRFLYSMCFNSKTKAFDIINDMLQTCRGFLYYSDGKLKIKIGKNNEVPVMHFSENLEVSFTTTGTSSVNSIYGDFSTYMNNFWKGDSGEIEILGVMNHFVITNQTSTYIDVTPALSSGPGSSGIFFNVKKDNIKKDTFSFQRRADSEVNNRIRIEFLNRDDDFRIDTIEMDDTYNINNSGEIREQTFQMHGIKRKTQAARMAAFYLDSATIVEFLCEFETDILGYFLTLGDIITVTHPSCNFNMKAFRIVGMEETQEFEVKLSLVEYVAGTYHDSSCVMPATESYHIPNMYAKPSQVTLFTIYEDGLTNTIKFAFKKDTDDVFWTGVNVFMYDNATSAYQFMCYYSKTSPSVKLETTIDAGDTVIAYDAATMYSAFPASGTFFLEDEEIYYSSIDDINDEFEGCTRGYNNSQAASHTDAQYCVYKAYNMPSREFSASDIGMTYTYKAVSINIAGSVADPLAAPTASITITGKYLAPPSPCSLEINGQGNNTTLAASDDAVLTWDLVTTGLNKGYGYYYGYDEGYGAGTAEGLVYFGVKVYKASTLVLLRSVTISDLSTPTYNYTAAFNASDNGSYDPNLIFYVYQISGNFAYSSPAVLVTNS